MAMILKKLFLVKYVFTKIDDTKVYVIYYREKLVALKKYSAFLCL